MTIKTADDIFREKAEREKEEAKQKAIKDIKDIFKGISPKKKKKFSLFKWICILFGGLFFITLILGFIWLIKFFIRGLF